MTDLASSRVWWPQFIPSPVSLSLNGLPVACFGSYILITEFGLCYCIANQLPRRLLMDHQPKTGEVEELLHLTSFLAALELPRSIFHLICFAFFWFCHKIDIVLFTDNSVLIFSYSYFSVPRLLGKSFLLWMENWLEWHSVFPPWMSPLLTSQWGWRRVPAMPKLKMLSSKCRILLLMLWCCWILCKFVTLVIRNSIQEVRPFWDRSLPTVLYKCCLSQGGIRGQVEGNSWLHRRWCGLHRLCGWQQV